MARIALLPLSLTGPFVISDLLVASLGRGGYLGPICTGDTAFSHETVARILNLPLPPADTFLDLAVTLCRGGLVVVGDCIATRAKSFDRIHDAMSRRSRLPGRLRAANALDLVRAGSASLMETRTRLMVVRAGLPEPALNPKILDRFGSWVATGDLVWKERQIIGKLQGCRAHDGLVARRKDSDRRNLLEDLGWVVVEIFFQDTVHPARRHRLLTRLDGHLDLDPRTLRL